MLRNLDTCFQNVITYIQGCLILVLLGLSGSTQATTFYLAPTGVDSGPCTVQTQPCLSLERADALVNPGDEVGLAGGIYSQVVSIDSSGTASAPITWLPLGNGLPILDGPTTTSTRLLTINANWNVWQGIDVRDSGNGACAHQGHGIVIRGSDNTVRDMNTYSHQNAGLKILPPGAAGDRNTIINVRAFDDFNACEGGKNSDGMDLNAGAIDNVFQDVEVFNNGDDGIDVWKATDTTLIRVIAHHNGRGNGNGDGFKLGPGGDSLVLNCMAYANRTRGFDWNGATTPNTLINNTCGQVLTA